MPVYFRTPSRKRLHKMNRRQHKKLHLGEFQTLIFGVQGSLHQAEDDAEAFGRFMDELIAYLVVNGFEMAGGAIAAIFRACFKNPVPEAWAKPRKKPLSLGWQTAKMSLLCTPPRWLTVFTGMTAGKITAKPINRQINQIQRKPNDDPNPFNRTPYRRTPPKSPE